MLWILFIRTWLCVSVWQLNLLFNCDRMTSHLSMWHRREEMPTWSGCCWREGPELTPEPRSVPQAVEPNRLSFFSSSIFNSSEEVSTCFSHCLYCTMSCVHCKVKKKLRKAVIYKLIAYHISEESNSSSFVASFSCSLRSTRCFSRWTGNLLARIIHGYMPFDSYKW